ncbi:hypothetical protein OEZ86_011364 [Tetradesmus obliquus]|nr:hypothetical protein OEZ86_011364 [Tetradesmus obliquus]
MLLRHAAGALQVQRPTQCPCNTNVTCARWRSRRQQPQHLQQVHLGQRPATCAAAVQDEAGVSYDWSWSPGKSSLPEQSPFDAQHAIPEQLTLQDLLALLSAAAADDDSSEPPSEAWVQQLTARAAPLLQQLQAPQACQVVQQLSQLDYTPGEQWMGAVMQQLCSQLQGLTPQQLSGLMWSLSNLRYTPVQQHWAALLSAGQSCLQDFYGPDLAYFLCAAGSIYANNNSSFDLETGARQQPGLAYLHALRTIHRDIKCANLLLDKEGVIKLADLGMAKQLVEAVSVTQSFKGSAFWMDIPQGSRVLSIDVFNLLCVTDEPLRTNAFGSAAQSDWQMLHGDLPPQLAAYLMSSRGDWFKRLVCWLLWLSRHGSGIWPLYMQLLPREEEMCSLMNFAPEERSELQCPDMEALAEKERSAIQGLHDTVFSSSTGELAALDLAPEFKHTLWAACMVNSRCFSDNVGREALSLMVPCADMANHGMQPNAAYKLEPDSQSFSITTTEDVPAGAELLISYLGSQPSKGSAALMKDYGFVLPGNINDSIAFAPAGPTPLLNAAQLLDAAAQSLPLDSSSSSSSTASDEAVHRRRQQAVMKSLKPFVALGDSMGQGPPGNAAEQQQLATALVQQCQEQLDRHATSIQQDEQLLAAVSKLGPRLHAAVQARLERKWLLATAQQMLTLYASRLS